MIKSMLQKLIDGNSLNLEEAADVMNEIMAGKVNPSLLSGILIALKSKGETAEEIAGFNFSISLTVILSFRLTMIELTSLPINCTRL